MDLDVRPVPAQYQVERPCPQAGCKAKTKPVRYGDLRGSGIKLKLKVGFACSAGHKFDRDVDELWELLHEDRAEAMKENAARALEEMGAQLPGDGPVIFTFLAKVAREEGVQASRAKSSIEAIVAGTGLPRVRVEAVIHSKPQITVRAPPGTRRSGTPE